MLKKLGKYMKGLGFLSLISALGMIIEAVEILKKIFVEEGIIKA